MALQSRTFSYGSLAYGSYSNAYILELVLTEESISQENNTSEISYLLQLRSGPSNRFSYFRVAANVTLDGSVVASRELDWSNQISLDYNSSVTILSGKTTVAHNTDGTKGMSVSFGISMPADAYSPGTLSVTGKSMELTAIARASTISGTSASIGGTSVVVINSKSENYTHTVAVSFGNITGYLDEDGNIVDYEVFLEKTTLSFAIPESFYNEIPKASSGICYLDCTTYFGGQIIGDVLTGTITVTAEKSLCSPEVSGTVIDINEATKALTGDSSRLIKYHSTAECIITATAKNGAYIKEKKIAGTAVQGNSLSIANIEISNISFWANDSRDYAGSVNVAVDIVPYVILTNNASVKRTDPTSGNAELTIEGNFFDGSFGLRNNSLSLQYRIGSGEFVAMTPTIDGGGYSAKADLTGLSYTNTYTITVVASDELSTVTKVVKVGKGMPVFDWGQDDFRFNVPVNVPQLYVAGKKIEDYMSDGGARSEFVATAKIVTCTPLEDSLLTVVSQLDSVGTGYTGVSLRLFGRNLLDPNDVSAEGNTTVSNGVVFQMQSDNISYGAKVKVVSWDPSGNYLNLYYGPVISEGRLEVIFEKTADTNRITFGVNGSQRDTVCGLDVSYLLDGYYALSMNFTDIVQGSISWCDMQIEPGMASTAYEEYRCETFYTDFGMTVYGGSYDWQNGLLTDENGSEHFYVPNDIYAFPGINTLFSSTGKTKVIGELDTAKALPNILSRVTNIENSTTGKGEKGDKGDTPVKGTDYFTEADKAELVSDVLAALPEWTGGMY